MSALRRTLRLPEPLCAVLVARGLRDPDAARHHLRPLLAHLHSPEDLTDALPAVHRIQEAIRRGETILVHGDYDVDGICAAALYTRVLRRLGARVESFVPHRLRDGYDFGEAGLRRARAVGASLILTADCGIVAHGPLERAAGAGIDVIVTDHHTPGDRLPAAVAVVNPCRADCGYPGKTLCGAGVAFKVCSLLAAETGLPSEEMAWYLDLVAVATVADLVRLEGENRVLVRYGLRVLERTRNAGLRALLAVTGLTGRRVEAGRVAFVLAPRINAAGRVGDAAQGLKLLLTDDPVEAETLALALDEHNRIRREEDRRTLDEALELLEREVDVVRDHGVVLAREGWHPGVIGIVASRVVERIHRPTVLVALDGERGRGSARSIPGFDLFAAVKACGGHLDRFGGHAQAAGMDLRREALPAFREAFAREAAGVLEGSDLLEPRLRIDVEVPLQGLDLGLCDMLRYLGPHGIGNPRPVFLARGVEALGRPRTVGNGHLKLRFRQEDTTIDAIGFNLAERLESTAVLDEPLDAVFQLEANEYRGRKTAQAKLLDLKPSRTSPVRVAASGAGTRIASGLAPGSARGRAPDPDGAGQPVPDPAMDDDSAVDARV